MDAEFTDDEKKELKGILKKFEPNCVDEFIWNLEHICLGALLLSRDEKKHKPHAIRNDHDRRKDSLDILEPALRELKKIANDPSIIKKMSRFEHFTDGSFGDSWFEGQGHAFRALEEITPLVAIIKAEVDSYIPKPGKPVPINQELAQQIADVYMEFIGRPTSYPDGPFCLILETCFKTIGLPLSDPHKLSLSVIPKR